MGHQREEVLVRVLRVAISRVAADLVLAVGDQYLGLSGAKVAGMQLVLVWQDVFHDGLDLVALIAIR